MTELEKIKHKAQIKAGIIQQDLLKDRVYEWLKCRNGKFTLIRYYIWVIASVFLTNYFCLKDRHSLFLDFKAAFMLTLHKFGIVNLNN